MEAIDYQAKKFLFNFWKKRIGLSHSEYWGSPGISGWEHEKAAEGLRKKKGQRVGWNAYGCCNWTLRFRRTWPTAATWSHEEMPQDLKGLGALLTMSKNKKWKLILENPEVSPSPSLIRSWLKLLLTGHWTKGIKSPAISQSGLLLHCGLSGRQASFAAVRGTGTNFPVSPDWIKTVSLSDPHSSCYFGLFSQKSPLLPKEWTRIVLFV